MSSTISNILVDSRSSYYKEIALVFQCRDKVGKGRYEMGMPTFNA